MLDIKVLGTGCVGCLKTEQMVIEALGALGVRDAKVELVTEERMIEFGLLGDRAPGLLINGKLAWAGSVPAKEQVTEWLQQALATANRVTALGGGPVSSESRSRMPDPISGADGLQAVHGGWAVEQPCPSGST